MHSSEYSGSVPCAPYAIAELETGVGQRLETVATVAGIAGDGDLLDQRIGNGARRGLDAAL